MSQDRPLWAPADVEPVPTSGGVGLDVAPSSVTDDDLDARLAQPPPSRRALALTRVLAGGLALVLAVTAGAFVAQRSGSTASAAGGFARPDGVGASGLPSGLPGMPGAAATGGGAEGGATGGGGSGAASTTSALTSLTGTVTVADGTKVYVTTSGGSVVTIVKDEGTVVAAAEGAGRAISAGDTVVVTGTTTDGALTADSIIITKGT